MLTANAKFAKNPSCFERTRPIPSGLSRKNLLPFLRSECRATALALGGLPGPLAAPSEAAWELRSASGADLAGPTPCGRRLRLRCENECAPPGQFSPCPPLSSSRGMSSRGRTGRGGSLTDRPQSMRRSAGIVDADDYGEDDIKRLRSLGVQVLPVSEIENLVLLPDISRAIAEHEGYKGAALERCLLGLEDAVFAEAGSLEACDAVVTRYCRRRIDRLLKRINLSTAANVTDITREYERQTEVISVTRIAEDARERIITTVRERNLRGLLACYDNKGLFALAAQHLKGQSVKDFKRWLVRVLSNDTVPKLDAAIRAALPRVGTADTRPSVRRSAATVT